MESHEGYIDVPGGRVWFKRVGSGGVPLLVLHGGPGFCHDYLEALADLADRRQVIFFDQLGCGRSDRPDDDSLWTVDFYVEEVEAVRRALGLEHCHLFGNSWGGMLAMAYVLERRPSLVSVTISNSPASMPRFVRDNLELKTQLPEDVQRQIDWHEERGFTQCPEYQAAIALWYQRHICRMAPWPEGLERSFAGVGLGPYLTMVGPSEFNVTGNLRDWDVTDRLGEIDVPTLFVSGEYDEIRPAHVRDMHEQVPGSELHHYANSAHLPFEEERERFMADYNEFLARTESA
jgi:proline-specific peptidase